MVAELPWPVDPRSRCHCLVASSACGNVHDQHRRRTPTGGCHQGGRTAPFIDGISDEINARQRLSPAWQSTGNPVPISPVEGHANHFERRRRPSRRSPLRSGLMSGAPAQLLGALLRDFGIVEGHAPASPITCTLFGAPCPPAARCRRCSQFGDRRRRWPCCGCSISFAPLVHGSAPRCGSPPDFGARIVVGHDDEVAGRAPPARPLGPLPRIAVAACSEKGDKPPLDVRTKRGDRRLHASGGMGIIDIDRRPAGVITARSSRPRTGDRRPSPRTSATRPRSPAPAPPPPHVRRLISTDQRQLRASSPCRHGPAPGLAERARGAAHRSIVSPPGPTVSTGQVRAAVRARRPRRSRDRRSTPPPCRCCRPPRRTIASWPRNRPPSSRDNRDGRARNW